MYQLWSNLINFVASGSNYNNTDTYILYGATCATILIIVVILDKTIDLIKSFFK